MFAALVASLLRLSAAKRWRQTCVSSASWWWRTWWSRRVPTSSPHWNRRSCAASWSLVLRSQFWRQRPHLSLAPVDFYLVLTDQSAAGDNILTAVNVAKTCSMVASDEQVIFVDAKPQTAQSAPILRFNLEDEVPTMVGPASVERLAYLA